MKYVALIAVIFGLIVSAYFSSQSKITRHVDLKELHLNMTLNEVHETFGAPFAKDRNQLTYILEDDSQLYINFREDIVTSAKLKYRHPVKVQDPEMRKLTLVQMDNDVLNSDRPSWFFAGKPEEGLIYKITQEGTIESLTWVPPFTHTNNRPKQLQALFQDFHGQQLSKL